MKPNKSSQEIALDVAVNHMQLLSKFVWLPEEENRLNEATKLVKYVQAHYPELSPRN